MVPFIAAMTISIIKKEGNKRNDVQSIVPN